MAAQRKLSAREKFAAAEQSHSGLMEQRLRAARDGMNENLDRIARFLPNMLADEARLRATGSQLDDRKLKEFYFGGFELERVRFLRLGVNVFQIGLSPYGKSDVEAMPGFKALVKSCAAKEVDMDINVVANPGWACQMVEIRLDRAFDVNGPYKNLVAPAARAKGPRNG